MKEEIKLPKQINWLGKKYKLFIYKDFGWSATYALPEYFCEECNEKYDPIMIYDYGDNDLGRALEGLLEKIKKIVEQEKEMKFVY